jgi:chromodomain-containing protein
MAMPDLEDPQDEWEVEEVLDKKQIKDTIHYLVKWANWPSEYNSYKPASHLKNVSQAVTAYEQKAKCKRKSDDDSALAERQHRHSK